MIRQFFLLLLCLCCCVSMLCITCIDDDDDSDPTPTPTATATPTPDLVTVSGTVYDLAFNPVANMPVFVDGQETKTNSAGQYSINTIPSGTHFVTAIYDFYSSQYLTTKVSDSEKIDLQFQLSFSYDYVEEGKIEGDVYGYSDSYPQNSLIKINAISENGWMDWNYLYDGSSAYVMRWVEVGKNLVIATELAGNVQRLYNYTVVADVLVEKNKTTTLDLTLSADGIVTLNGTYPTSYYDYSLGSFGSWLNFSHIVTPGYYMGGGDIWAGGENMTSSQNGAFTIDTLPVLAGATRSIGVVVYRDSSYEFRNFYNFRDCTTGTVVNFTEEVSLIYITQPGGGATNVGGTPLITWNNDQKVFRIELFTGNNDQFLGWTLETMGNQLQLPSISSVDLTAFDEVGLHIRSQSDWDENFTSLDPNQTAASDFTLSMTYSIFYPGEKPNLPGLNKNTHRLKQKPQNLFTVKR